MKINHRHFVLVLFSFATLIVAILGYWFLYNKTIAQAEYYVNANREVEGENEKKKVEQDSIKIHEETKVEREKLITYFVHEDKVVDFIEKMEKIGADTKVDLEIGKIETLEGKVKAELNIKGPWIGIMNALTLIENISISSTIYDVNVRLADEKNWSLGLTIEAQTIK